MKVLTTLMIFGLAALAYAAVVPVTSVPPQCPPEQGENVTLLPNPDDCSTYYACDRGRPVLMKCPPGLHFNDREKVCDWPSLACCDPAADPENKCNQL